MKYDIRIDEHGTKRYYINNVLYREDGPAIEYTNGDKHWFKNGMLHREDGPAIELNNGNMAWFFEDHFYGVNIEFTNESWKKFIKTIIFS